jgi:hypothetical protein
MPGSRSPFMMLCRLLPAWETSVSTAYYCDDDDDETDSYLEICD